MLKKYVIEISDLQKELIEKYWPNTLSIIFDKNDNLSDTLTCGNKTVAIRMPNNKLLLEIMQNAFYAHELNLYLDIYPNDANRIKLYNEYNKKTNDLISKYNNTYEPLTLSGNELNEVPWSWEDSPWPWEGV